jgi:hypothetical protein
MATDYRCCFLSIVNLEACSNKIPRLASSSACNHPHESLIPATPKPTMTHANTLISIFCSRILGHHFMSYHPALSSSRMSSPSPNERSTGRCHLSRQIHRHHKTDASSSSYSRKFSIYFSTAKSLTASILSARWSVARASHAHSIIDLSTGTMTQTFKIAERQQSISIAASDSSRNKTALGNLLRPREKRADICTAFQRVFEGFCHDLAQGWDRSSDRFCYGC